MRKKTSNLDGIRHSRPQKKFNPKNSRVQKTAPYKLDIASRDYFSSSRKGNSSAKNAPVASSNFLKIIPLGGQEEVGRNMTVFEYDKDIIILDMGLQFPEEDMPGIDYIVPNVSYLKGKEKNIRGVIFSHGHLDHIGAAPILLKKLGYPPIIGRDLTLALIKKKVEEYAKQDISLLKTMRIGSYSEKIKLGNFKVGFFEVEHSIMDSTGVTLETASGTVIHPGDWTMDKDGSEGKAITYEQLSKLPEPRILMLESIGAVSTSTHKVSTKEMYANLERILSEATGRVIVGTFSSQIKRIGHILEYAEKIGKKVALDGYSMKMNVEIAKELGYIKAHKSTLIPVSEINNFPENKVILICTGAQGEGNAVLSRIITDNHKYVRIKKNDTVIFSSSIVPGNERTVQRLKDNLYRKSDNVIHSDIMDVHTSGHCNQEDIRDMLRQVKPQIFVPVYANHFFLKESRNLAIKAGFTRDNIFILDNGNILEVKKNKAEIAKKKVDTSYVMVDGLGIGDVGQVVLRDRQLLSADGMFVITVILDSKSKQVVGNIQVTSRGFIYVKENFDLVNETKRRAQKAIQETTSKKTSVDKKFIEDHIREVVGQFLFQKTERRPMVLPVVIEV